MRAPELSIKWCLTVAGPFQVFSNRGEGIFPQNGKVILGGGTEA